MVDDSSKIRPLIVHILEIAGYEVMAAEGAEQALDILAQADSRIDLLVTDLMLPRMSGIELGKRAHERWPEMKVLYMSGYDAYASGQTDFIEKPFKPDVLVEKVQSMVG